MAFVVDGNGSGYVANLRVMDRGEEKATMTYELRAATEAAALTAITTIITNLNAVSTLEVLGYNLLKRFINDAIIIPSEGQLQEKARVAFRIANSADYETFDIPAPKDTIFLGVNGANSEIVDVADAALVAYGDMFKAAGVAFISDGEDLDQLSRGERVSTRKGMRRGQ